MEICLVILFLSRKKFYAKEICLLSSSMKLGPGLNFIKHVRNHDVLTECPLAEFLFHKAVYQKQE